MHLKRGLPCRFNGEIDGIGIFFQIHISANSVLMHGLPVKFGSHHIACEKIWVYHAATARLRIENIDFHWRQKLQ